MTAEKLRQLMELIDNYYGKPAELAERKARAQVYAYALKDVPDDVAATALNRALTVCRYPSQLLVDWCAEIRKAQTSATPSAAELWADAQAAAREISQNLAWARSGGLLTSQGVRKPSDLLEHAKAVFAALPPAVQTWAGTPQELVYQMERPLGEIVQYVRPGFCKAVQANIDAERLPLSSAAAPRLDAPRVDRAQPSGSDFLADVMDRPRRHKRKE